MLSVNTGNTRHRGLEAEASYDFLAGAKDGRHLTVFGSGSLLEEPDTSSKAGPSRLRGEAGAAKRKKRMAAAADEQGQSRSKKRKVGKKESTVAARLRQARRRKNNPTSSEDSESSGRGT